MRKGMHCRPWTCWSGFESAARHLSFTKAGEELYLTQSAVSRQIKELEDQLGVPLFQRRHRALALTEAGHQFYAAAAQVLSTMRAATERLRAQAGSEGAVGDHHAFLRLALADPAPRRLHARPSRASTCASPPTPRCRTSSATASTSRCATARPRSPGRTRCACSARRCSRSAVPKLLQEEAAGEAGGPAQPRPAAVRRSRRAPSLAALEDLARSRAHRGPAGPRARSSFSGYEQIIPAAVAGHGVALGRSPLVKDLIAAGELVAPFKSQADPARAYFAIVSKNASGTAGGGRVRRMAEDRSR